MARAKTIKIQLKPDQKYNSVRVTRLINYVMKQGKKKKALHIVYNAFELIAKKTGKNPVEVFEQASENVRPQVEVKPRRVGGANLQIPIEVRSDRQEQLILRWTCKAARKRNEPTMAERLAYEILAAAEGEGNAVKEKVNTHKAAESHKAYSHLKY